MLFIVCVCAYSVVSNSLWPTHCNLPGSLAHGILQARILEWAAVTSSGGSSLPRDPTCVSYVSYIGRQILYHLRHRGSPSLNSACKQISTFPTLYLPLLPVLSSKPSKLSGFSREVFRAILFYDSNKNEQCKTMFNVKTPSSSPTVYDLLSPVN